MPLRSVLWLLGLPMRLPMRRPPQGLTGAARGGPPRPSRYPPQMFLGVDHLVIAVADPDEAAAQLERELGLAATGGGRHDALGTFNRLIWLGDSYLELIGVFDRALAESSSIGAPTLRTLDMGGGLVTWATATDELEHDVAALRGAGSDLGEPIAGERRRTDGDIVRWRLSTPRQLGPGDPPFLIEHRRRRPSGRRPTAPTVQRSDTRSAGRSGWRCSSFLSTTSTGPSSACFGRQGSASDHRSAAADRATRTSGARPSGCARGAVGPARWSSACPRPSLWHGPPSSSVAAGSSARRRPNFFERRRLRCPGAVGSPLG